VAIQIEKKSFPVKLLVLVITVLILNGIIIYGAIACFDMKNVSKGGTITISEGMTVVDVANQLKDQEIIKFPVVFRLCSRQGGYDKLIKPGTVEIKKGMSYTDILNVIKDFSSSTNIVIPEGYEIKEIASKFSGLVSEEEFYAALQKDYDYKFLENLPERESKLEGYLFPATYYFPENVTAEEIVNTMLKTFDEHFLPEYYERAAELGMSVDDVITLASIIERESNTGNDRAKISGVFHNRLKQNMRLQSCATIQYILKERKTVLSTEDTKIESPYNTYINDGLPIGPISSPGEECIKAALYPEETTALYFVLGEDGKHIFSDTFEEHRNAKNGEGNE